MNGGQALAIELEQMVGVVFGLGSTASALEADAGGTGAAIAGGHGDELHEVERNVLIAAGTGRWGGCFVHECLQEKYENRS